MKKNSNQESYHQYEYDDFSNRDIYNTPDRFRGERKEYKSRNPVYYSTIAAILTSYFFASGILSTIALSIKRLSFMFSNSELQTPSFLNYYLSFLVYPNRCIYTLIIALITGFITYIGMDRNWKSENEETRTDDINQYIGDSDLVQPEDMPLKFDIFPDAGYHSSVDVTAVIGHMYISNRGLKKINMTCFSDKDQIIQYDDGYTETIPKGEPVIDENEKIKTKKMPLIDTNFGQFLLDTSGVSKKNDFRKLYNPTLLKYNPENKRDKSKHNTVAQHINSDWYLPSYERQRAAGMYIVDTAPTNTMIVAMTRAGKGQTVIEPTVDMWSRQKVLNNIVMNDPKGELLVKFYYLLNLRGYDVVVFNLMNIVKTNIYNPLGYAVDAARQGDNQKVEEFVNTISEVFFSAKGSEDPMWPNAASAAFKRSAFGLIDYYMEEDRQMRLDSIKRHEDPTILNQKLDEMWGHVTLYNVYQMMTQLSAKVSSDPNIVLVKPEEIEAYESAKENIRNNPNIKNPEETISQLEVKQKDFLTLFFDATSELPINALRTSAVNQDNMLRAMAGSKKTISSVYGIALTAMLFFTDDKISSLTSGRPSQNFDINGLGFPRRIGIRFDTDYMHEKGYMSQKYKWTAYKDKMFQQRYTGKDFEHEGFIDKNGWSWFYFKGIFENMHSYLKLQIFDDNSNLLIGTYYFEFIKDYRHSLNGRFFVKNPVLKKRVIDGGNLKELHPIYQNDKNGKTFISGFKYWVETVKRNRKSLYLDDDDVSVTENRVVIMQTEVHYVEQPKAVFFVTPPHLMTYSKIILILLNQMFNMQVDKAYLTKANQKPLYKTKYMLDEVGNLQSDGKGIPFLQTKESIGLGQDQQYTLVLQTFQQLRDVYGDSIDKILQGNTGNIIFLKSTDDSLLDTLEKMSGTRHEARYESKSVTKNSEAVFKKVDSKIQRTISIKEVPVINKNDMLLIPSNNSMVFGKGKPIWNRNQMALPMNWALSENQTYIPGYPNGYALSTVPSMSNTDDFDVRQNQPDFIKMVAKRVKQARLASKVIDRYKKVNNLDDDAFNRLDVETVSQEIMRGINENIEKENEEIQEGQDAYDKELEEAGLPNGYNPEDDYSNSNDIDQEQSSILSQKEEMLEKSSDNDEISQTIKQYSILNKKVYAEGQLSKEDIQQHWREIQNEIIKAYTELISDFNNSELFKVDEYNQLYFIDHETGEMTKFIETNKDPNSDLYRDLHIANSTVQDANNQNVVTNDASQNLNTEINSISYSITQKFIDYLTSLDSWTSIINGKFDRKVGQYYKQNN